MEKQGQDPKRARKDGLTDTLLKVAEQQTKAMDIRTKCLMEVKEKKIMLEDKREVEKMELERERIKLEREKIRFEAAKLGINMNWDVIDNE